MPSRFSIVVFLAVAGFLYYQGSYFGATLVIGALGYYVLTAQIHALAAAVGRTEPVDSTVINCRVVIERILAHPSVVRLHAHLLEHQKTTIPNAEAFTALLVDSYKTKYKRDVPVDQITFHVKNSVMFTNDENGTPQLAGDSIYHVITIPYDITADSEKRSYLTPSIELQIEIRLLMVNGILTIQVGAFDEDTSPRVLKPGNLSVYQKYETITAFPLMYFAPDVGLPVPYLNLSAWATESYKASLAKTSSSKERFADWRVIQQDVAVYEALCESEAGRSPHSVPDKARERFTAKAKEMVEKNGFKTTGSDDGESWRYPDRGKDFWNPYLTVMFQNMNLQRSFAEKHWLVDYYEKMP